MAQTATGTETVDTNEWYDIAELEPTDNFDEVLAVCENVGDTDNASFRLRAEWDDITAYATLGTNVSGLAPGSDPDFIDDAPDPQVPAANSFKLQAQADTDEAKVRGTLITEHT